MDTIEIVAQRLATLVISEEQYRRIRALWSRFWRYATGSVITAVFSQLVLFFVFSVLRLENARDSAITATLIGAIPSYFINRYWAWGKKSPTSFRREVLPYILMAVTGLIFSTWFVDFSHSHAGFLGTSRLATDIVVQGSYLLSFVLLWFGKFTFMHKWLFRSAPLAESTP
ncbi:MAG: GtrA family protein [Ferrimicrobium sp.]|uniref:GtrA family protein n=1 Tax=Ferrimicrobium sp. TaxID=2926050 RepID=UPI0026137E1C|nr:GtrA family protein [Ferrimicrobium sp.]